MTQRRLRDGQIIGSTYDNLNRVTLKDLPAPEADVVYAYDLQNRPLSAAQGGLSVSRAYDALGRMQSESTARGAMSYQYDPAGRRVRTTWPDGFFVTQDFLVTGEVAAIRESGAGSGPGVLALYSYDNFGRRTSITRGNGTTTSFGYDPASRLTSLAHDLTNIAQDVRSTFGYNPASQLISWSRNNPAYAWTEHYNQNLAYGVNGLNQVTSVGATSFTHDGRGNLVNQGAGLYGYTVENRLISAPNSVSFAYDPLGRLSQSAGGGGTTQFQYDSEALVAEYNASNQLLRRYVHGPGVDEPLVWYEGAGTADRRWLHQDERGSVIAASNASGAAVALNSYDEYGVPDSGNLGRFQYTGQSWLPEIGMYYYKARIYAPKLGRFLQTDPIGYKDDINLYAYVGNDPLNKTDPTGREGVGCWNDGKGCAPGAAVGAAARTAYVGIRSDQTRSTYESKTGKLDPTDSAGRAAAKSEARANTPTEVKAGIEAKRPGLGPKEGSGGTANRTNTAANQVARNLGKLGKVAGAAAVVTTGVDIATSDDPARAAAANAGAIAGGLAGGEVGASIGALGGPVAPITAPVGGLIGGAIGGVLGYGAGERAYDEITP